MTTVRRSIEVPVARHEAVEAWGHFLESVLVGRRKLACDEVACVNGVGSAVVSFEGVDGDRTRLVVDIPVQPDETDQARELLEHKASHDLVLFWSYIDGGDYARERRRPSEDEKRSGSHSIKEHVRHDSDQMSVRRSFRA